MVVLQQKKKFVFPSQHIQCKFTRKMAKEWVDFGEKKFSESSNAQPLKT